MNEFFEELKRRNVVKVAVAYTVVAWVIAQVLDLAAGNFAVPEWFTQISLIVLILGLPVALILSWAYELTPQGVKKTKEVDADKSITPSTGKRINKVIAVGFILAIGFIAYDKILAPSPLTIGGGEREASIAVLPFADLSSDGSQEYFGDGIAEEILNVLAKIPDMKVAGRTSSFKFKGQNPDFALIGQQLNVDHVLEGSIRKDGNKIRITAQLISADDGFHLWSDTYDRDLVDIFKIQDDISHAVAEAMQVHLGTAEGESVVQEETDNPEAYALYLRARQLFHARRGQNMMDAMELLEAVTVLDPDFSKAWSTLALTYNLLPFYAPSNLNYADLNQKAFAAANRALETDPDNYETYAALVGINLSAMNWREAEINAKLAERLAPNDAEVMNFVGDYYRVVLDVENSIEYEKRAFDLNPLHEVNARDLAIAYIEAQMFDEAVQYSRKAMDLDLSDSSLTVLVRALTRAGQFEEAKALLAQHSVLLDEFPMLQKSVRAFVALYEGDEVLARQLIREMEEIFEQIGGDEMLLVYNYFILGDYERGVYWYQRAYEAQNPLISARAFFFPGNYTDDTDIINALNVPGMEELFELRRDNWAKYQKADE